MKARLNTTILAILALAICAAWAAPAQAEPLFEADSYPATIDGAPFQASIFIMEGPYRWECKTTTMKAELTGKASSLTVTPTYGECRWNYPIVEPPVWSVVTVLMNGCDYSLHGLKWVKADEYTTSADLQCPAGKQMVVELKSGAATICRLTVPAQANISGSKLIDKTGKEKSLDDVELQLAMSGMKYTQDLTTFPIACPIKAGTYETFAILNQMTLTGTSGGKGIGLRVSGE